MSKLPQGPRTQFRREDLWRALAIIGDEGLIGRKKLAEELGVGEGSARTLLDQLKERDLVVSRPSGHSLTERGEEELAGKCPELLSVDAGSLTVAEEDVATIARNAESGIRRGVEERDEAMKAGAEGATILVSKDQGLRMPGVGDEVEEDIASELVEGLNPSEGDVIIISSGENRRDAERGALAAAESLQKTGK
ncbi:hypothetical protein AKJ65_07235 [candidate division MSBL1 archaeon SCGC-AAA259E19]|uniref:Uncharacterized protein n=2 Tax=candidate division MSBL1 TaxID=215777 RepID=A0A133V5U7_9EURY|nr:hypothetical protein AKJ65_07235 [candidate division MSBL1 archaeon SCGC-AAA259E19]KXB01813.1 hypothetical protein AKJ41_00130 [candidate division MSBL1 archaeon SCGC-AAA259O05]